MGPIVQKLWDFSKTIVIAAFLAFFLIRGFIFEPFRIPSNSMVPTLLTGDFLFVSKYAYGNRMPLTNWFFWQGTPQRGDIAVFKNRRSNLPGSFFGLGVPMFIKRVIGLPGDRISYQDKQLIINGQPVELVPQGEYTYTGHYREQRVTRFLEKLVPIEHDVLLDSRVPGRDLREMIVPEDMFVVMGDNRDNSRDSRAWNYPNWGFVPRHDLMGRAEFIWWSWDESWTPRWGRLFNSLRPEGAGRE
jgi:signal peptidase I